MPDLLVREIMGSQDGVASLDKGSSAKMMWMVSGSNSVFDVQVYLFANAYIPGLLATFNGFVIFRNISCEYLGQLNMRVTANYVDPERQDEEKPEEGSFKFAFDTTGGVLKIKSAIEHLEDYAVAGAPLPAPNHHGTIGIDGEGCEIVIPALRFTYTVTSPEGEVDEAFAMNLARKTGFVNDDVWHDLQPGEALFMGATGSQGTDNPTEVVYHVLASENLDDFTFANIEGIVKDGHDYLWFEFEAKKDDAAKKIVTPPLAAHIERVYQRTSFADLLQF